MWSLHLKKITYALNRNKLDIQDCVRQQKCSNFYGATVLKVSYKYNVFGDEGGRGWTTFLHCLDKLVTKLSHLCKLSLHILESLFYCSEGFLGHDLYWTWPKLSSRRTSTTFQPSDCAPQSNTSYAAVWIIFPQTRCWQTVLEEFHGWTWPV